MTAPDPRLEPFLFDAPTVAALLELSRPFDSLLLLGCPSLSRALAEAGDRRPRLLVDLDARHGDLPGFVLADFATLARPARRYALAMFDPPALRFPPESVAELIERLFDPGQPLLLSYPAAFLARIATRLAPYRLAELSFRPGYLERNRFNVEEYRLYASFPTP